MNTSDRARSSARLPYCSQLKNLSAKGATATGDRNRGNEEPVSRPALQAPHSPPPLRSSKSHQILNGRRLNKLNRLASGKPRAGMPEVALGASYQTLKGASADPGALLETHPQPPRQSLWNDLPQM